MSLEDDVSSGAALASMELHRAMITLMVLHETVPRDAAIELIDHALQRIETMQMAASFMEGPAQAARLHIEVLLAQLRTLPASPLLSDGTSITKACEA